MKIVLSYKKHEYRGDPVPSYPLSFHKYLSESHEVIAIGHGHETYSFEDLDIKKYDLIIDLDSGRDGKGNFNFQFSEKKSPIPSAVWFIDSHGGGGNNGTLHKRTAKNYDHVFFAVWDKRDIFSNHKSAHWCPCASDDYWFDYFHHMKEWNHPKFAAGFFGSKGGLDRADILKRVGEKRNLLLDVREVGSTFKPRWPRTAQAMANCKILFNRGQKHDGPNQRVIESMLMNRPLITNKDSRDGMSKLFKEFEHYLGYETESELGNQIDWAREIENKPLIEKMARRAYMEVKEKHLIKHRVDQILEVVGGV